MTSRISHMAVFTFIAFSLMFLIPSHDVISRLASPRAALDYGSEISHSSYPGIMEDVQNYIHRGDWEPPDILLLAENPNWQDSLEIIVAAAYRDGTPVYILAGRDDIEIEKYLSLLNYRYGARILSVPYDTPWIRDYGPIQLKARDNAVYWLDFN